MSIQVMTWVWTNYRPGPRSASKKLLLLCLADYCDDDGVCYPGVSKLAEKCEVSPRRVQQLLDELKSEGQLMIAYQSGVATAHGNTNRYILIGYRKGNAIRGEGEFTPEGDGVKGSSPQGVKPASPKPSVEPSDNNNSARAREEPSLKPSASGKKAKSTPAGPDPEFAEKIRLVQDAGIYIAGQRDFEYLSAVADDFTLPQWQEAIRITLERRAADGEQKGIRYLVTVAESVIAGEVQRQAAILQAGVQAEVQPSELNDDYWLSLQEKRAGDLTRRNNSGYTTE